MSLGGKSPSRSSGSKCHSDWQQIFAVLQPASPILNPLILPAEATGNGVRKQERGEEPSNG
jgi:hypothetical protein